MSDLRLKKKINVLFVCIHNSARSQMAEAFLKQLADESAFNVESAGIESGELNPLVVESMKRIGIDISKNKTKTVSSILKKKTKFNLIVFVCSESQGQSCPIIPYKTDKIYWNIKDPSALLGTSSALAKEIDSIRNQIKSKVLELIHNKM